MLLSFSEAAARVNVSEQTIAGASARAPCRRSARARARASGWPTSTASSPADPAPERPARPCRVVAVANQKGGVGKTSTAPTCPPP